jgi:heme exporter protein CcmB
VWRTVWLLVGKDLRVEWRAKELVYATCFFAVVVLLVFAFAFLGGERPPVDVAAGVLWVALTLAGTVGVGRAFEREREGDTLRALLLSPAPRGALYLAKLISILLLMGLVETVCALLLSLLFQVRLTGHTALLVALLFLGTLGFAAVAALFGAALGRARSREVLLPLLIYPLIMPALIAGTRGTVGLLQGDADGVAGAIFWLKFLGVFDAIFVSLALWVWEPVARGDT